MNKINMLRRLAAGTTLLAGATLLGGTAYAQGYGAGEYANPAWYLLPSINGINPDNRFGTDNRGEGFGIRLGRPVSPSWDIQFGPVFSRVRDGSLRYRQGTLGLDALYLFSRARFSPFVLVGGGAEYDQVRNADSKFHRTSPYINAGVGLQYAFSNQWGMQADVRRAHSYLRGNEFNFNRANTNVLTVGLRYAFDKPMARTPVARTEYAPIAIPEPKLARQESAPAPRFDRYTLASTELFAFDSAELTGSQAKLDEIAYALNRNPQIGKVTISGYTDRMGTQAYNQQLSQRRADAVKRYLTDRGVAAERLQAIAMGEQNPEVNCTDTRRADLIKCLEPNRRVESEQLIIEPLPR